MKLASPQFSEPSDAMNHDALVGSDIFEHGAAIEEQKCDDPLDKFLPPPPKATCSPEMHVSSTAIFSNNFVLINNVSFIG